MRYYGFESEAEYEDALTDARIERDRERRLEMWRRYGPEYYEDWMGEEDDDDEEED